MLLSFEKCPKNNNIPMSIKKTPVTTGTNFITALNLLNIKRNWFTARLAIKKGIPRPSE